MTKSARAKPTTTLLAKIKRAAKVAVRDQGLAHTEALERGAAEAGYASWHELQQAVLAHAQAEVDDFPVDPPLRRGFDSTPNEDRTEDEISTWWDRPFAITLPSGGYMVRCLDGGAWDRSSNYGVAPDLPAARRLAEAKLAAWKEMRSQPYVYWDGEPVVVRSGVRPGQGMQELYRAKDSADAARWISEHTARARQAEPTEDDKAE